MEQVEMKNILRTFETEPLTIIIYDDGTTTFFFDSEWDQDDYDTQEFRDFFNGVYRTDFQFKGKKG